MSLGTDGDTFWCTRPPAGTSQARSMSLPAADPNGLVLFTARDALVEHAHHAGRDAWVGRGGEMHCMGLLASQTADWFVLETELVVRLVQESSSTRVRWRSRVPDTLALGGEFDATRRRLDPRIDSP